MNIRQRIAAAGGQLVRAKKHLVFRLPTGANLVVSKTPSDRRSELAAAADLRHALGAIPEHREGVRRERRRKPGRQGSKYRATPCVNSAMADALRVHGAAEAVLRAENDELREQIAALVVPCPACRLFAAARRWFGGAR